MLDGGVTGDLDEVLAQLHWLQDPDLAPLAQDIAVALVDGNREGLLAGLDADGAPMAPLEESTIRRGRQGDGPPTDPGLDGSSLIRRFRAGVEPDARSGSRVVAGWDDVPQVRFFVTGTRHMVRRNPVGIRPATRQRIQELVNDFARMLTVKF